MGKRQRDDHQHSPPSSAKITANPPSSSNPHTKRPVFPSYLDSPILTPKIKLLCEVIATAPSLSVEALLDETGVRVTQSDVEQVLKLSYSFPGPAVKFFRWAGFQLNDNHSPYAWNLVVDLLGKNFLFDAMWDAIKSMKRKGLVSLATFASVFGSYVIADKVKEAIMTFEVMDQYGCPCDVVALNSFLSAICRDGKVVDAAEFLHVAKNAIRPDADSYAILLEGWEKEKNVVNATQTFTQMVTDIGWDPANVPAYETYLSTLLMGRNGLYEAIQYFEAMKDRRCYPGMKFFRLALEECLKFTDVRAAGLIWRAMVELGFRPDIQLFNVMIALYCYNNDTDAAQRLFDEMVSNFVFPDAKTYNLLFQFFIKCKRLNEAAVVFHEMIKNECIPSHANCCTAIKAYINTKEPYMAIKVWKCMIENYDSDLEKIGNLLVVGLCDLNMLPEAVKYAEGMIEKGIKVASSSLSKLKRSLTQDRKPFVYEELLRKWSAR